MAYNYSVMESVYLLMTNVYDFFQLQITIDEYSFTLWSVFIFGMVCIIVARFVGGLIR